MRIISTKDDLSLIEQIACYEDEIKKYYPNYKEWFQEKMIPGILQGTRTIIGIQEKNRVIGFISLKKEEEKKICTIFVDKENRGKGLGTILVEKGIEYLETDHPLLTIPVEIIHDYQELIRKYHWEITDSVEKEHIVNGPNKVYLKK